MLAVVTNLSSRENRLEQLCSPGSPTVLYTGIPFATGYGVDFDGTTVFIGPQVQGGRALDGPIAIDVSSGSAQRYPARLHSSHHSEVNVAGGFLIEAYDPGSRRAGIFRWKRIDGSISPVLTDPRGPLGFTRSTTGKIAAWLLEDDHLTVSLYELPSVTDGNGLGNTNPLATLDTDGSGVALAYQNDGQLLVAGNFPGLGLGSALLRIDPQTLVLSVLGTVGAVVDMRVDNDDSVVLRRSTAVERLDLNTMMSTPLYAVPPYERIIGLSILPPASCGNGILDPGEACDDANILPGDGCSPTCTPALLGAACRTTDPCAPYGEADGSGRCVSNRSSPVSCEQARGRSSLGWRDSDKATIAPQLRLRMTRSALFGALASSQNYGGGTVCVFRGSETLYRGTVPSTFQNWSAGSRSRVYRYRDGLPDGVFWTKLHRSRDGTGDLALRAEEVSLNEFGDTVGASIEQSQDIGIRFVEESGECAERVLKITHSAPGRLRARAHGLAGSGL